MAQVKVSVDTTGRKGAITKHIVVHSNDLTNPLFSLTIRLNVTP